MGSENRNAGIPHGRFLVRQRQFDLNFLMTLSNTERRTRDPKPLEEMTSRNPDDKRPLLVHNYGTKSLLVNNGDGTFTDASSGSWCSPTKPHSSNSEPPLEC